jgi:hypothetical protein
MSSMAWCTNLVVLPCHAQSAVWRRVVESCNTTCYGSPNLTLIIVISGLVIQDATGLINSKSSQRYF